MSSSNPEPSPDERPLDPAKLLREAMVGGPGNGGLAGTAGGWQPPSVAELAPCFGELEVVELVGRGGMGAVYRAVQRKLGRDVALKILPPELAVDGAFEERFLREARALAGLKHERILTVHDFGERDGLYFLITEFVEGMNLRQLMDMGELSPAEALRIAPQICEALQFAHDHGVVHRDVKPENVLIDLAGEVRIADFGLARIVGDGGDQQLLTRSSQILGTPHYMAPEQWRAGKGVDHRADIYAVGVVLYEMLTGQLPLGHFDPPSKRKGVPPGLDEVVKRSLAQQPEQRYQQARDVSAELRRQEVDASAGAVDAAATAPKQKARGPHSSHAVSAQPPRSTRFAWAIVVIVAIAAIVLKVKSQRASDNRQQVEMRAQQVEADAHEWLDARGWKDESQSPVSKGQAVAIYYQQKLLPDWERRMQQARQEGQVFGEPRPLDPAIRYSSDVIVSQGGPPISLSMLIIGGAGIAILAFVWFGFSSIRQIRERRQGTQGLALSVFTAWIVPSLLITVIPTAILTNYVRDADTSVIAGTCAAVVLGVSCLGFMFWRYRDIARELS